METTLKELIAPFLGIEPGLITADTPLNRNSLKSSIHLHRMYSRLNSSGYIIDDYSNIKCFGDLLIKLDGSNKETLPSISIQPHKEPHTAGNEIGIDVEDIDELPVTRDFRNHEFYQNNFSAAEISYCILQHNPYASFAGLFAAKEALIKANNQFATLPFNTIIIEHTEYGRPTFRNYSISISHSKNLAIAVVVKLPDSTSSQQNSALHLPATSTNGNLTNILSIIAIIISVITMVLLIVHRQI